MGQRERRWWHYALPAFLLPVLAAFALTWTGATPVTTGSATQERDTLAHGSKGMAGSLPDHPVSGVSFRTGLEELPASLEGTVVPDVLRVDAQGNLVITPLLRDVMEYFLSTLGEEDLATIVQRLQAYFANNLPATAAEQAQHILKGYLAWRDNLGQIHQAGGVDAARLDVDAVRTQQQAVRESCLQFLGQPVCTAFFARQQARDDYALERLEVIRDESLSAEQKAQRLAALTASLPAAMQADIAAVTQYQTLQQLTAQSREEGLSDAQLQQIRDQVVGPEAASRLQQLDQQRADFDRRMAAWLEQRLALLHNPNLSATDREAQIAQLREQQFSQQERVRVQALERLSEQ